MSLYVNLLKCLRSSTDNEAIVSMYLDLTLSSNLLNSVASSGDSLDMSAIVITTRRQRQEYSAAEFRYKLPLLAKIVCPTELSPLIAAKSGVTRILADA